MRTLSKAIIAAALVVTLAAPLASVAETDERRLSTVFVKTLPPHKGELHINPIIVRDADFARPGFSEAELVFVPVATTGGLAEPLDGKESQDRFKITATLPMREKGLPFVDTPRDYRTKDVILPKGAYALTEIAFVQKQTFERVSYCLNTGSFAFDVTGGDIIFMGLLDLDYPPADHGAQASHDPVEGLLAEIAQLNGWRQTRSSLTRFEARPVTFKRDERVCKASSY